MLAVQGLRATSRGGHIAVQDTVIAQFGDTVRCFRAFSRLRRNRNRFEYPGDAASEPTADDVDDALNVAREAVDRAATIVREGVLTRGTDESCPVTKREQAPPGEGYGSGAPAPPSARAHPRARRRSTESR